MNPENKSGPTPNTNTVRDEGTLSRTIHGDSISVTITKRNGAQGNRDRTRENNWLMSSNERAKGSDRHHRRGKRDLIDYNWARKSHGYEKLIKTEDCKLEEKVLSTIHNIFKRANYMLMRLQVDVPNFCPCERF